MGFIMAHRREWGRLKFSGRKRTYTPNFVQGESLSTSKAQCSNQEVLITHLSHDDNKGDVAILEGTVKLLREHWPYLQMHFHSVEAFGETSVSLRFSKMLGPKSLTTAILPPISKSGLRGLGRVLASPICFAYPPTTSLLSLPFFNVLARSSRVVCKGGSYLLSRSSFRDYLYLYRMLFPLLLSYRLHKPFALLGVSVGPIENSLLKHLTTYILSKASFIAVREEISLEYVQQVLKVPHHLIHKIPDLAFYSDDVDSSVVDALIEQRPSLTESPVFGITARYWQTLHARDPDVAFRAYLKALVQCATSLLNQGWQCLLIAHSLEDKPVLRRIYDALSSIGYQHNIVLLDEDFTLAQLRGIYRALTFLIGTRLHSIILAATVGTPSVAIAYERNKGVGVMQDLGMGKFVCPFEDCALLNQKVSLLLRDAQELREHLKRRTGQFRDQLRDFARNVLATLFAPGDEA